MTDEVAKKREQREDTQAGVGNDGHRRYIEVVEGRPFITTATHDPDGNPNPPATAANFRRLAPQAAEALRAQGAARRPATADSGDAAAAVAAERQRIHSILNLDHAKGREALARELALTPGMSVDHAASILAAAPAERPEAWGCLAPDPDDDARSVAESATEAARRGGFIR